MSGWTNKGKKLVLEWVFREQWNTSTKPTNLYVALTLSTNPPTQDTNTFTELDEIATGNGYTSGGGTEGQLSFDTTDFNVITEDDTNDRGLVQIKDITWTASGGPIPASGNGARYAVLLDDNGTVANREVLAYWDLTTDRSVSDTNPFTLADLELRANES